MSLGLSTHTPSPSSLSYSCGAPPSRQAPFHFHALCFFVCLAAFVVFCDPMISRIVCSTVQGILTVVIPLGCGEWFPLPSKQRLPRERQYSRAPPPSVVECWWTPSWMDCQWVTCMSSSSAVSRRQPFTARLSILWSCILSTHSSAIFFSPVTFSHTWPCVSLQWLSLTMKRSFLTWGDNHFWTCSPMFSPHQEQ